MNNDAKDIIGRLRATNVLLLLLHVDQFAFPLDEILRPILGEHRPRFLRMMDLVAALANFGDMRGELLSSVDDILGRPPAAHYTRDYLDMLLSLYAGRSDVERLDYENLASVRSRLATLINLNVCELLQSVVWIRIAFYSCYPGVDLPPLQEGWVTFCRMVCSVGGTSPPSHPQALAASSLRSWRLSDIVRGSLEKQHDDMPHKDAFAKAVVEVDEAMKAVQVLDRR